jgi:hypothetical protein
MATRRPKALINGRDTVLPTGDTIGGTGLYYNRTLAGTLTAYEKSSVGKYVATGVTDSNGLITIYPTSNGLASGTALFSQIFDVNIQVKGTAQTISTFRWESTGADLKSIVVRGREISISLLGVVNITLASSSVECVISVEGLLV